MLDSGELSCNSSLLAARARTAEGLLVDHEPTLAGEAATRDRSSAFNAISRTNDVRLKPVLLRGD
jgi:hypothetical protein